MIQLTDAEIKNRCENDSVYKRGIEYYLAGRIHNFTYNKAGTVFQAFVMGTSLYRVMVQRYHGELYTSCTCPAKAKYGGDCKHIAAVLMYIKNNQAEIEDNLKNKVAYDLFKEFEEREYIPDELKQPVNIEVTLESDQLNTSLSLRMGIDKLYVVKSIKKFFDDIDEGMVVEFGKGFSFDPSVNTFKDEDMKLIKFLREIYEIDKINTENSYYRVDSVVSGKYVRLTPSNLEKFIEVMNGSHFNLVLDGKSYYDVDVAFEDLPINFKLEKGNNGKNLRLIVEEIEKVRALDRKGNFFCV